MPDDENRDDQADFWIGLVWGFALAAGLWLAVMALLMWAL